MAKTVVHPANERGHADHGWLNAHHSFSFAGYYDPSKIHFGALRVLNDDIVAPGMGFGMHPHDNMEIITIILRGSLEHKDNMGHAEAIRENEVQVMSAGTGVLHSEYNPDREHDVNLLQIWMFPEKRNIQPRYDQAFFNQAERVNVLQTIVSPADKTDGGLKINQQAWIYRSSLDAGRSISHSLHSAHHGAYIFVIEGTISVNGNQLNQRDALGISDIDTIEIAADNKADFILLEVPMVM